MLVKKRLGDILLETGKITKEQLDYAVELQKKRGDKLGKIFVDEGMVFENEIIEVLEFQLGIPHVDLDKYHIDADVSRLIPETLARKYSLIPVKKNKGILTVAMSDPLNIFALDELRMVTGLDIQPAIATQGDIRVAIGL